MCSEHHEKNAYSENRDVAAAHMLCPDCDLLVRLPQLELNTKCVCPRCKSTLTSIRYEPRRWPIACALSALIMLVIANSFSFIYMNVAGIHNDILLLQIPKILVADDYVSMATLFLLFVQFVPVFCMISIILLSYQHLLPKSARITLARILFHCQTWCMAEIFLAGVLVSFVKLIAYGDIGVGGGFIAYCIFCLFVIRTFQFVDRRRLWHDIMPEPECFLPMRAGITGIEQGLRSCPCCRAIVKADDPICPRCSTRGHVRRPHSLQWTMALLFTALILYIPANILPMMLTLFLGSKSPSTILAGVMLLWGEGSYPVAAVIFIASIMVPSLKIAALAWLCWDAKYSKRAKHEDRERMHILYEMVEFVGRWSMIDVFVIAVLATLVNMGRLMSIYPDIGAVLFASVVIITMIAAMTFDPRLIWDRTSSLENKRSQQ